MAAKLAFAGAKPFAKKAAAPGAKRKPATKAKARTKEPSPATLKSTDKVITTVGALRKLIAAPKSKPKRKVSK